jgi:alkanesulfonate monooxygenase
MTTTPHQPATQGPPIKLLWYLTAPDGPYPWQAEGRWDTGFGDLQQIAVTADRLGFYGVLLGTSSYETLAVAPAMIGATERLRFLVAQHPGRSSPPFWPNGRRPSITSLAGG